MELHRNQDQRHSGGVLQKLYSGPNLFSPAQALIWFDKIDWVIERTLSKCLTADCKHPYSKWLIVIGKLNRKFAESQVQQVEQELAAIGYKCSYVLENWMKLCWGCSYWRWQGMNPAVCMVYHNLWGLQGRDSVLRTKFDIKTNCFYILYCTNIV